jgi:rod shape-determining protein MreD
MVAEIMTGLTRLRLPLVVVLVLVVQMTVLVGMRIHGAHPDAMILIGICAGMVAGPSMGAAVGFGVGLVTDLFLETPFGLSALVFMLVGFAVGMLQGSLLRPSWWVPVVAAVVASAGGEVLYAVVGATVGQSQMLHDNLPWIVGVVAIANGVLALPMMRLMAWAIPEEQTAYSLGGR